MALREQAQEALKLTDKLSEKAEENSTLNEEKVSFLFCVFF